MENKKKEKYLQHKKKEILRKTLNSVYKIINSYRKLLKILHWKVDI